MKQIISDRKIQHLKIVLEENVEPVLSPFKKYRLEYKALPEIDKSEISTEITFLGKKLSFPFLIGSMTGGAEKAKDINKNLAIAAEKAKVAIALGSMRAILKDPSTFSSFDVRKLCPSVPLLANMGLVQLNYGYGAKEINKLIDLIDADGIFLHINHLQEAIQPEGDTNFKDLILKLEKILPEIKKPVFIKEVGSGIDFETAKRLSEIGIQWIDVAGLGGTSWTSVESFRRNDKIGFTFEEMGIETTEALIQSSKIKGLNLISSGGVRSGLDMAKSIALGAKLVSCAKPLLKPALESSDAVYEEILKFKKEFEIAMFVVGAKDLKALAKTKITKI